MRLKMFAERMYFVVCQKRHCCLWIHSTHCALWAGVTSVFWTFCLWLVYSCSSCFNSCLFHSLPSLLLCSPFTRPSFAAQDPWTRWADSIDKESVANVLGAPRAS
ncbi:hypothetical protein BJ508DRAFT_118322 [Ascobolus immersus RN42]|uniref:Uncharacterized protein n=1 Tax=Ascobolus immersus RN42 TaxID=1160509 RepID=A0A3N4I8Q3_ASCIM|nr:hypothetical protein BJ508DRAFT_118322 [Ascobolus immersus RN42]